jgi:DNA-binding transcriptional LysR family regulator
MDYQLELRHYRYFLALANELNFRKAAESLFISQPGLSRQIKQMEDILGVALFYRTQRTVQLSTAGQYLKNEVEFLLNHIEGLQGQMLQIQNGQLGEVRIGFLGSAMQIVIPNLLLRMNQQYPNIHTSLEEMSNQNQVDAILRDELDLGFVRLPSVIGDLHQKDVYLDHFTLVLPEDHELTADRFVNINQVSHERFILFSSDYSPHYYQTIFSIFKDAGFTPEVSHKSIHAQTIFKLVEQHLGIAIIPHSLQYGFDYKIKFLDIPNIHQRSTLSAIWKKDNRNPCINHVVSLL